MSYVTRLIGNLKPGIINESGKLSLPDVHIEKSHIKNPTALREEYGNLGKGLEYIVGNQHINEMLSNGVASELIVSPKDVQGLRNLTEAEQKVVKTLLTAQHNRSQMLYRLASNEELQAYDNVTKGVFKGTTLGAIVGVALDGAKYVIYFLGVPEFTKDHIGNWFNKGSKILTELVARAGPGLYEATTISREVLEKENNQTSEEKHMGQLFVESIKELPRDSLAILKTAVDKELWYEAANIGGIVDKARGIENKREKQESYIKEWSKEQRSAPPRGIAAKGITVSGNEILTYYFPSIQDDPTWKILYAILDAGVTTYINVGNNLQGCIAVYKKCLEDARKAGSPEPKMDAWREFLSDPFQLGNLTVVTSYNILEAVIRSLGFRPEEAGFIGAALESSVLSWDTAWAAQISKKLTDYLVVSPAKKSVRPYNLMVLALEHNAKELQKRLNARYGVPVGLENFLK